MAEIFISYKSERRRAAGHLARILEGHGFTVWFDYQLVKGRDFARQIDSELRQAKAVVVLWCTKSVASDWVTAEADLAQKLGKLVPVMIEPCELLVNFRLLDYIDLSGWDGAPRSPALDKLIDELERHTGREAAVNRKALAEYEETWRRFGAPPLQTFALEAALETVQARDGGEPANPGDNGVSLLAIAAQEWPSVRDSGDVARLLRFEKHFARTYYADEAKELREKLEGEDVARRRADAECAERGEPERRAPEQHEHMEAAVVAKAIVASRMKELESILTKVIAGDMRSGQSFRDAPFAPEMVVIPAGKFLMGSKDGEGDDNERPQHLVTIARPFAVGKYAVTFDEWDACLAAKGTSHNPRDEGWGRGRRPVINVSWHDAQAYAAWLSKATGQAYRLLSEAEWEYCCRAETVTAYSTGGSITEEQAQFDARQTVEVGSYPPNAFGLYDMHGNVGEWCEDTWHSNYNGAPGNGSAWGSGDSGPRVLRGGTWFNVPRFLRAANRIWVLPNDRLSSVGFRLARTLSP